MSATSFPGTSGNDITLGAYNVPGAALTIVAWARQAGGTGQQNIFSKADGNLSANQTVQLQNNNGTMRVRLKINGSVNSSSGGTVVSGTWHHFALTWNGIDMRGYLDGVLTAGPNAATGTVDTTGDSRIGAQGNNGNNLWNGSIRHLRIYDRAFSAGEVAAEAAYRIPTIGAGLVDWWPLNYTGQGATMAATRNIINKANAGTLNGTLTGAASPFGEYEGPRVTTYGG